MRSATRSTAATECSIAAIETRRYRYPLDPPFSAAWDPEPRTHQDATIVVVRSSDGVEGYASGDGLPGPRAARGAVRRARSDAHRHRPRDPRDRRLPSRAQLDARGRRLGSRRPSPRSTPLASPRRPAGSDPRLRIERRARVRRRARAPLSGTARRGCARGQAPAPLDGLAPRPSSHRGRARRNWLGPGADGRRQSGVAHAG